MPNRGWREAWLSPNLCTKKGAQTAPHARRFFMEEPAYTLVFQGLEEWLPSVTRDIGQRLACTHLSEGLMQG